MSKLIFLNLAIDPLWDEERVLKKVFPARVPVSENLLLENLNWSLFFGGKNDLVITYNQIDESYRKFLSQFGDLPKILPIKVNPYDSEDWLGEWQNHSGEFLEFVCSGVSTLEEKVFSKFDKQSKFQKDFYIYWNNKIHTFEWCKEKGISFPETEVKKSSELLKMDWSDHNKLIKAPFSSGGGGTIFVDSEKQIDFLSYIERVVPNSDWLVQEKIANAKNYSFVSQLDNPEEYLCFDVDYDGHGLSKSHECLEKNISEDGELKKCFKELSIWRKEQNYFGPLGFDALIVEERSYPLIDWNVRFNKAHVFQKVCEFFGVDIKKIKIERLRFQGQGFKDFDEFWKGLGDLQLSEKGENNDRIFIPFGLENIFDSPEVGRPREISYIVSPQREWIDKVSLCLAKLNEDNK